MAAARRAAVREAREEAGLVLRAGRAGAGLALGDADAVAEAIRHLVLCRARAPMRRSRWTAARSTTTAGWRRTRRWRRSAPARIELPPPTFVTITAIAPHGVRADALAAFGARPDGDLRAAPLPDRGRRRDALRRRRRLRRTASSNAPARAIDCGSATTVGATSASDVKLATPRSARMPRDCPSDFDVSGRVKTRLAARLHEGQHALPWCPRTGSPATAPSPLRRARSRGRTRASG